MERKILTVGTLKAFFHILLPFSLCGSHRSGVAGGSLINWHLPLCGGPEESSGDGRGGAVERVFFFLQPFAALALLGSWALMPVIPDAREGFAAGRCLSRRADARRGWDTNTSSGLLWFYHHLFLSPWSHRFSFFLGFSFSLFSDNQKPVTSFMV